MKRLFTSVVFLMFFGLLLSAQVKFSATPTDVNSDGSFDVILNYSIAKNWHIYGKNPEIGTPTTIDFKLPKGFKVENIKWQKEKKFSQMGMQYGGYEGETQVFVKIVPTTRIDTKKTEKFSVKSTWLACSDTCVPEEAECDFSLTFKPTTLKSESSSIKIFSILLGAFIGGMILNLMPCVFPVIGIKILSFAKSAGQSRKIAIVNAFFYTLGIVASFLILALILLGLRATGESLGWGFQLQNPIFSALMALLFFAMAMSFAGFYEIGASFSGGRFANIEESVPKNQYLQSALSGILAVLVASPCTAPFMGSALGIALSTQASSVTSLAIFVSLGFGMASPYVLFSAIPKLAMLLPKAGSWLETFKKILSLPLFITSIWLAWLYSTQTNSIFVIIFALIILFLGLFIYGKYSLPHISKVVRHLATISAIIAIISSVMISTFYASEKQSLPDIENKWSAEKLAELRKQGYCVYVDFTAKWCLTCQYNKQILYSKKIEDIFKNRKIKILVGDWTSRNDAITKELEKFGRAGVPLNLLYAPQGEPIILPAILTESSIIEAVDKIK